MCAKPVQGFDYNRNFSDFVAAMHAALRGPERQKIPIITYDKDERDDDSHGFNVKTVKVTREGDLYVIDGSEGRHISHRKGTANDDQVYYKVFVDRNNIAAMRIEWTIKSGGVLNTLKDTLVDGMKEVIDFCKQNPDLCKQGAKAAAGAAVVGSTNLGSRTFSLQSGRAQVNYQNVISQYEKLLIVPKDSWEGAAAFLIACIAHLAVMEGELGQIVVQ